MFARSSQTADAVRDQSVYVHGAFQDFLTRFAAGDLLAVLGHSDVDGLTATAILLHTLDGLGFKSRGFTTRKGENAWTPAVLERVRESGPAGLIVCDLGSRKSPLVPGIPTLLLDHHQPTGIPPQATLISGYGWEPTPTSGLLASWCHPDGLTDQKVNWMAAISVLADLGDKASFSEWQQAVKKWGASKLRTITTLLNAPRRVRDGDATVALAMLMDANTPDDLLADSRITFLKETKTEFDTALAEARRIAPKFSGPIALIMTETSAQVHPMVAQSWMGRLRKNIIICANRGFLPPAVNFAVRTALDIDLLQFLAERRPAGAGEEYGRGHRKATGGSLQPGQWAEFVGGLGFD